ncbi:CoA activase [Candidatus Poribacteria bacterium]|nr:CoA activase [Candidatus Poribacteria bacterium]
MCHEKLNIQDNFRREGSLTNCDFLANGIGIDVGSTSANVVVSSAAGELVKEYYVRTKGRPVETVYSILKESLSREFLEDGCLLAFTGSAGKLLSELLNAPFINEIVVQTRAACHFHPETRSIIEIGGESTRLITVGNSDGGMRTAIEDFAMNSLCAAGTGSFLDQQASRLGLTIEEFGALAMKSKNPSRIAGRCSVFAKSDMIHLQQIATPDFDIVAGLCYAVARNFKSNVARGKILKEPVVFQGGVAANPGVRKALAEVLGLEPGALIIPKHHASMGAIGVLLIAGKETLQTQQNLKSLEVLEAYLKKRTVQERSALEPLGDNGKDYEHHLLCFPMSASVSKTGPFYLGIDVGSISTNLVVIDEDNNVVARRYLMTAGRPIEAVRLGLGEIGEEIGVSVPISAVGTTGSGRYLAGGFVGADVVRNEITAQATAALQIDPSVDTIFEIGGQDSKYIGIQNGAIVDFEMNKVCAAGTGSFLEEQAERLGIEIDKTFGKLALSASRPAPLGERCTVFIESDLMRYQQTGAKVDDLVAGLSYSIVHNYLNKVVGRRRIGKRIFFQGGTAYNQGVVAAFGKVVGQPVIVPPHHDVTGAIGAAILAKRENAKGYSNFKGFDLSRKKYTIATFGCKECSNMCEIQKVSVEGEKPTFYGSRCEKYEVDKTKEQNDAIPDLFAEREEQLLNIVSEPALSADAPVVGIPRALFFHEQYPFWKAFFSELGIRVMLSDKTNKQIIHQGVETVVAEFCFPIKVAHGHVLELIRKGVRRVFIPSVIDMQRSGKARNSFNCPYVQSFPYTVRSSINFKELGVEVLSPVIYFGRGQKMLTKSMIEFGRSLNRSVSDVKKALAKAQDAQNRFYRGLVERGKEILAGLRPQQRAMVIISRSYNGCDSAVNLGLPQKLRRLGVLPLPIDMMPWEELPAEKHEKEIYWKAGQRILQTARIIEDDPRLFAVYLTNFGCGPDSFVSHFFRKTMAEKPYLQLEIDEHSADAGIITRCEAFLDSLKNHSGEEDRPKTISKAIPNLTIEKGKRTVYIPYMCDHSYALLGAFQACGVAARVMDESNEETLDVGRKLTTGRECYPCILTTGDMVKTIRSADFDPDHSAFFMPAGSGPCRFGQYHRFHRLILDELGYSQVPVLAPNQDFELYTHLGMVANGFSRLAWSGIVAIDLLEKSLRETQPYESIPGKAEEIYKKYLREVCVAVARRDNVAQALKRARSEMGNIPVREKGQKPVIGVVGEIYVRGNRFSNENIVRNIERLGGEVWMPPLAEWIFYINHCSKRHSLDNRFYGEYLRTKLEGWFQQREEENLYRIFHGSVSNLHEPSTEETLRRAMPFIHPSYEGEAVLSIGKSIDYIHKGVAGIVNTIPFTCMPGTIVTAVFKRFREEHNNIPILNLNYDGQGKTNAQTRLEAFMYQVNQYHSAAEPQPNSTYRAR